MFTKLKEWTDQRHDYARAWKKKTGGKVIGYFCTYAPEEIMYAAGVLPVRLLGSHEPLDITEPYIFGMFCPFCRDVLAQGLKGRYDYLDGIMIAHSCLHIRQSYASWKLHVPTGFTYYLPMPNHVQSPSATPCLTQELASFKEAVEEWTGKSVTNEALDSAIEVYNTNRRLMRQIYELRRSENPPLTGLEAMYMTLSSQLTDKAEHNKVLEQILKDLPERKLDRKTGIRLMMLGSENDDISFIEMVEGMQRATFVIDEHCTGSRYFWNEVIPDQDRLKAVATRYVDRPRCPSKDWPARDRFKHILQLAKDYKVEGALLIQQKFCDPHEIDIPPLQELLNKNGIPTYFLEFDVTVPLGQFRIRIEAFLEMLEGDLVF